MNFQEFNHEMDRLESCWPGRAEPEKAIARREVLWEHLGEVGVEVLSQARNSLIDSGLEFMPSVPEILDACREVEDASRPKAKAPRAKHDPAEHTCNPEKLPNTLALTELQWAFPYEAAHILCSGDIPATCPLCGKQRIERGIFDDIMKRHPQDTTNWNGCYKGLMICQKCDRRAAR